jgi:hypothetical protein
MFARTGGKDIRHYSYFNNLTPVTFVTTSTGSIFTAMALRANVH